MHADPPAAGSSPRCPTCWTPLPLDALNCPACGSPLSVLQAEGGTARALPGGQTPPAQPVGPGEKACAWCGQLNPAQAERCSACAAAFPQPENEAVVLRAATEHLHAVEEDYERRRRMPWWRRL